MKKKAVAARSGSWERVLLVDDDPNVGALVSRALGPPEGYTVQVCGSSIDALEHAQAFRPDLVLLDVVMPGMDGPATLKALRANETTADIPVIFMSARADRREAAGYRKLGALGVIPKPFDPALLAATLEEFCGGPPVQEAHRGSFDDLRDAYLSELPDRTNAMAALAAALVARGWERPPVESLMSMAHRLAGTSGLYRVDGLARAAGILEAMLKGLLEGPRWPPSRPPDDVATLVKAVTRCVPRGARRVRRTRQARVA